jgi:hypothetical protein
LTRFVKSLGIKYYISNDPQYFLDKCRLYFRGKFYPQNLRDTKNIRKSKYLIKKGQTVLLYNKDSNQKLDIESFKKLFSDKDNIKTQNFGQTIVLYKK